MSTAPAPSSGTPGTFRTLGALALIALAALVPIAGQWTAGLVSDDAAVLGYVHAHGPFADWFQSEYDATFVRFWRPMVTLSLDLQEAWTGVAAWPLRLLNWFGHVASAWLVWVLARQLGARPIGALCIGVLAAWFPYQGGTVVWIVGRVDSQCVPFALAALAALLAGRPGWTALCFFLALATKEVAIAVLPAAVLLTAAQRVLRPAGELPRRRAAWVALLATAAVTVIWRRLALGVWVGGYPGALEGALATTAPLDLVTNLARATAAPLAWLLGAAAVVLASALLVHARSPASAPRHPARATLLLVLAGLAAMAPLAGSLASGDLTPYHIRTTMFADALLCLVLVVLFQREAAPRVALAGIAVAVLLMVVRLPAARADALEWGTAGRMADAYVEALRERVDGHVAAPTPEPVLVADVPRVHAGAYLFTWGFAERFQPPFEPANAPIWAWRPLFHGGLEPRVPATRPLDDLRWPFRRDLRTVPELPLVIVPDAAHPDERLTELELTAALLTEPGPLLVPSGDFPGARFEAVLFTESGYHVGTWGGPLEGAELGVVPPGSAPLAPFGGALALRDLLLLKAGGPQSASTQLFEALVLAMELGATEAYLELRVVDDARGERHRPVATSRWVRLFWSPALRAALRN